VITSSSPPDPVLDRIRAAMQRAPETQRLNPEQRAECDEALERYLVQSDQDVHGFAFTRAQRILTEIEAIPRAFLSLLEARRVQLESEDPNSPEALARATAQLHALGIEDEVVFTARTPGELFAYLDATEPEGPR
jgi:hypothetical protein